MHGLVLALASAIPLLVFNLEYWLDRQPLFPFFLFPVPLPHGVVAQPSLLCQILDLLLLPLRVMRSVKGLQNLSLLTVLTVSPHRIFWNFLTLFALVSSTALIFLQGRRIFRLLELKRAWVLSIFLDLFWLVLVFFNFLKGLHFIFLAVVTHFMVVESEVVLEMMVLKLRRFSLLEQQVILLRIIGKELFSWNYRSLLLLHGGFNEVIRLYLQSLLFSTIHRDVWKFLGEDCVLFEVV